LLVGVSGNLTCQERKKNKDEGIDKKRPVMLSAMTSFQLLRSKACIGCLWPFFSRKHMMVFSAWRGAGAWGLKVVSNLFFCTNMVGNTAKASLSLGSSHSLCRSRSAPDLAVRVCAAANGSCRRLPWSSVLLLSISVRQGILLEM
jgi:hypothetical protein